jgi:uncharacterized membrane protein YfcA
VKIGLMMDSLLIPALFGVAFLYSTVGHAGASGYLAVMALLGWAQAEIRPTALILNIAVAAIGSVRFRGHFSFRLFWPFSLLSIPCAFLGGAINLSASGFRMLIGLVLLLSAVWFFIHPREGENPTPPPIAIGLMVGGGLGLLAGLTGTGGGIFLTPLTLLMHWSGAKTAAAVSAPFILVNSLAGLLGHVSATHLLSPPPVASVVAVVAGGWMGASLGSRHFPPEQIKRFLAVVLTIAGLKLIFAR